MKTLNAKTLANIRSRAAEYDAKNSFFEEDFAELKTSGYLASVVPKELGGEGFSLSEQVLHQRKLAAHSGATALGVNMHLLWGAVANILLSKGDERLKWVLEDIAAGEVFAFGISEAGNPFVLLDSKSTAKEDGNDFLVSGKKIFTTLSPVWTRLGLHAKTGGDSPEIVAGFIRRENARDAISYPDTWNPLGMRATQSYNTLLSDARMLGGDVTARYAPFDASDALVLAVSQAFAVLTSSVYAGLADRALELATQAVNLADADHASKLSDAIASHRAALSMLELLAGEIDRAATRDDWSTALAVLKNRVTDEARAAVDVAFRILGARAYDADSELARIYRDVMAGMFHPRNSKSLASGIRTEIETAQK